MTATHSVRRPHFAWPRVLLAIVIGEAIPILVLVAIVAAVAPSDPAEADTFARSIGNWVGPSVGALAVCAVSMWAGAKSAAPVIQGTMIGLALALLDVAILAAAGEPFQWVFVGSNSVKIAAGALGGWIARTRRTSST